MPRTHIVFPRTLPKVVGLLGGSFNPAHMGHLHISMEALKRLGISHLWWMVSPQNPLKSKEDMAGFATRMQHARQISARHKRILVTDIEQQLCSQVTVETLQKLQKRFPRTRFVWLMGADNLADIHRWEQWSRIFALCPILVLDRSPVSHSALRSKAAIRFKNRRVTRPSLKMLAAMNAPAWAFAHIRKHPDNATHIRKTLGKNAFLSHNGL